jgi:hypothetical protein
MLRARSTERAVVVLLGALTLAGCLLSTSLDGFTGGSSSGTSGGTTPDGATPVADGAPPPSGDAGRFCESKPSTLLVCADFDDGKFPAPLAADMRSVGTIVAATGDVRSPPFAALLTAPANSGTTTGAYFRRSLPTGAKSITVELDIHVEEIGAGADYDLMTIASGNSEIGFQLNADGVLAWDEDLATPNDAGNSFEEVPTGRSLPTGWAHLKWTLDVAGATAVGELFIDGTSVARRNFSSTVLSTAAPDLEIGDNAQTGLTKEWRFRLDNITVDLR